MRRFILHFLIFGIAAPMVGMWVAGLVISLAGEGDIVDAAATACGVMLFGAVLLSPVWALSALLNYVCCLCLDGFFSRFFRFDIILLGGIWGVAIAMLFTPNLMGLMEIKANLLAVALAGCVIGCLAGFFAARLAPNPSNMLPSAREVIAMSSE